MSKFFKNLKQSLEEAIEYEKGKLKLRTIIIENSKILLIKKSKKSKK